MQGLRKVNILLSVLLITSTILALLITINKNTTWVVITFLGLVLTITCNGMYTGLTIPSIIVLITYITISAILVSIFYWFKG